MKRKQKYKSPADNPKMPFTNLIDGYEFHRTRTLDEGGMPIVPDLGSYVLGASVFYALACVPGNDGFVMQQQLYDLCQLIKPRAN